MHNVKDFGAEGNGTYLDTRSIQQAIDTCDRAGGGVVYFPPGYYLSGTIFLRNLVTLHLDPGATLLASSNPQDYPRVVPQEKTQPYPNNHTSLIYGEGLHGIGIHGGGSLEGQGDMPIYRHPSGHPGQNKARPFLIRLVACSNVSIRDLRMQNSPMWMQHYLACHDLHIEKIQVRNECNHDNDGIDIDSCQDVRVVECQFETWNDGICLKSTSLKPCRNVVISNCIIRSRGMGIHLGSESTGGFHNITIERCSIRDTLQGGIVIEEVDGGGLERVAVENVTMHRVNIPLVIRLENWRRAVEGERPPAMGRLRNVTISNLTATEAGRLGGLLSGHPGHPLENIQLQQIRVVTGPAGHSKTAPRPCPTVTRRHLSACTPKICLRPG